LSGLAVNDLASAVAVGAQMGPGGAEMASVSKSARIIIVASVLILFSLYRTNGAAPTDIRRTAVGHIPKFVIGFLALALVRAGGDTLFGAAPTWRGLLVVDKQLVAFATVTVSVGIGLQMEIKGLLAAGVRAVALGAVSVATMSGLTLALLTLAVRGSELQLLVTRAAAMAGSFALCQLAQRARSAFRPSVGFTRRHWTIIGGAEPALAALTARGAHSSPSGEYPAS